MIKKKKIWFTEGKDGFLIGGFTIVPYMHFSYKNIWSVSLVKKAKCWQFNIAARTAQEAATLALDALERYKSSEKITKILLDQKEKEEKDEQKLPQGEPACERKVS